MGTRLWLSRSQDVYKPCVDESMLTSYWCHLTSTHPTFDQQHKSVHCCIDHNQLASVRYVQVPLVIKVLYTYWPGLPINVCTWSKRSFISWPIYTSDTKVALKLSYSYSCVWHTWIPYQLATGHEGLVIQIHAYQHLSRSCFPYMFWRGLTVQHTSPHSLQTHTFLHNRSNPASLPPSSHEGTCM